MWFYTLLFIRIIKNIRGLKMKCTGRDRESLCKAEKKIIQFVIQSGSRGCSGKMWDNSGAGWVEMVAMSQKSKMSDEPFQKVKALGWPDPVLILAWREPEGCLTWLDRHFYFLKGFVQHFRFLCVIDMKLLLSLQGLWPWYLEQISVTRPQYGRYIQRERKNPDGHLDAGSIIVTIYNRKPFHLGKGIWKGNW